MQLSYIYRNTPVLHMEYHRSSFFQVKIIPIKKYSSKNIFVFYLKQRMWKSHTMDGLVAVEDSEEATQHQRIYMEYSCGRNTPVLELDNVENHHAVSIRQYNWDILHDKFHLQSSLFLQVPDTVQDLDNILQIYHSEIPCNFHEVMVVYQNANFMFNIKIISYIVW